VRFLFVLSVKGKVDDAHVAVEPGAEEWSNREDQAHLSQKNVGNRRHLVNGLDADAMALGLTSHSISSEGQE